jgi:hypothetical protein
MSILFAQNAFLRIGVESTWGTKQVSTYKDVRMISSTLATTQNRERRTHLSVPASGMLSGTFDGFRESGGSIEIPMHYDGVGMLIEAALGNLAESGGADPYTHTYTPDETLPSLTIQFQRGTNLANSCEIFLGMKVGSMSISGEAGSEITASFELVGKDSETRSTNITPSLPSYDGIYHYEAGALSLGSNFVVTSLDIRSFELSLDNKLDRRNLLGSKLSAEPVFTDVREVTMTVTCDVTDNTLYEKALAGTQDDVSLTFTRTADTNHELKIELTNATIEGYDDSITSFGRVERTFTIRGYASSTDDGLKITIKNGSSEGQYGT